MKLIEKLFSELSNYIISLGEKFGKEFSQQSLGKSFIVLAFIVLPTFLAVLMIVNNKFDCMSSFNSSVKEFIKFFYGIIFVLLFEKYIEYIIFKEEKSERIDEIKKEWKNEEEVLKNFIGSGIYIVCIVMSLLLCVIFMFV